MISVTEHEFHRYTNRKTGLTYVMCPCGASGSEDDMEIEYALCSPMSGRVINTTSTSRSVEEVAAEWPDYKVMPIADVPSNLLNGYKGSAKV